LVQSQDLVPPLLHLPDLSWLRLDGENVWPLAVDNVPAIRDHVITGWEP
jgi:hypothetical protein